MKVLFCQTIMTKLILDHGNYLEVIINNPLDNPKTETTKSNDILESCL